MDMRKIQIAIEESVAAEIETLTKRSVEDIAVELLHGFVEDGRRRQIPMISLGISWPLDWYAMMLKTWGENKIASNTRRVLREFMMKDTNRKGWKPSPIPQLRNRLQIKVAQREVKPRPDRQTFISKVVLPEDWANWLEETYPSKRSTYVKLAIYSEIVTWPWPRSTSPSMPQGLQKFQDDNF